jgi:cysteine synthase
LNSEPYLQRADLFETLKMRALANVVVLDLTSPSQAKSGHESWAWDASALSPGGHYFPVFVDILKKLERDEGVRPETHVLVETTTGTAGIALGTVAKQLGYDVTLFMPEDMPRPRIEAVRDALPSPASELVFTPPNQYVRGMVRSFQKFLVGRRGSGDEGRTVTHNGKIVCDINHSRRPEAITALLPCIRTALQRLPDRKRIDYAIAAIGNGTSAMALFRAVRERHDPPTCVGIEPLEAPVAYVQKFGPERFGRQFGFPPRFGSHQLIGTGGWDVNYPNLNVSQIDDVLVLEPATWKKQLLEFAERGLNIGHTSAACQAAARVLTESATAPVTCFSIVYDRSTLY